MKKATKAIIFTQNGEINKKFTNALICAKFDENECKIYPCRWMASGRNLACESNSALIISVLKAQGYRYEQGSTGTHSGNYIKISRAAISFLKQFRQWQHKTQ